MMKSVRVVKIAGMGVSIACGLALLAVAGCSLEDAFKYSKTTIETKSVPISGVETLETRLGAADITVVTKDVTEAEFIIKKTYRASETEYGEKLLAETQVKIERQGSRLVVEREEKSRFRVDTEIKGFVSIDITVTLPAGIGLDVLTGSGDLEVDDRTGPVKVRSGSGDLQISSAGGGLEVKTGSGDARFNSATGRVYFYSGSGDLFASEINGSLEATTGSGELAIEKVTGSLDFSSGSGDISVESSSGVLCATTGSGDLDFGGHTGNAEISTSSGSIYFGTSSEDGKVSLKTSSGEVYVTLYGVDSMELEVSTMSGTITSKVPIIVKEASRRRLIGQVGAGGLKLGIATTSGDVGIRPGSI